MAQLDCIGTIGAPVFSHVEQVVLDIACREGSEQRRREGSLRSRLSDLVLGRPEPLPLANERLEALRQYVVRMYRHGVEKIPLAATAALNAAGYDADQITMLHMAFTAVTSRRFAPAQARAA